MQSKRLSAKLVVIVLAFVLLLVITPTAVFSEYEADQAFTPTTTAILTSANETTKKIIIESYLTDTNDTDKTIKPCDIIFVTDQSKWMNTEEDKGTQRATIISEIKELLGALSSPTYGEHRVAIAGYGRVNLGAVDPYDKDIYPGTKVTGNNISFNTGYYTANGFVSQNGWSDLSASQMSGTGLPKMSDSYKANMTYANAFMSLDEATAVLDPDTMPAWYAGASRMDAGLTIAEQLAAVANENDPDGDRNLIVCILASSLPIQNTVSANSSVIRKDAVLEASEVLKAQGATIFAFGDYHASGKTISGNVQDTEETFNTIMSQVCTKPEYFYSFANFSSVSDALNEMITQITITAAGEAEQDYTVEAKAFKVAEGDEEKSITWQSVIDYYGQDAENIIGKTKAKIEFYTFVGYNSDEIPVFESEPYSRFEVSLSSMVNGDAIAYDTSLIPIPSLQEEKTNDDIHTHYGNKIVITVSAPITISYKWADETEGYAPDNAILPDSETVVLGTTHTPSTIKTTDNSNDEHYVFEGWYTDKDCNVEYTGISGLETDITLYGKWEKYLLVKYHWNIWETDYAYHDDYSRYKYNEIPTLYTPDGVSSYAFDGWYLDKEFTIPYEPSNITQDINLYAKWIPTTWELRIVKKSDSGDLLPNARFALYSNNSSLASVDDSTASDSDGAYQQITVDDTVWYLVDVCLTDENGAILWNDLTEDEYYILELEAPAGYALGKNPGQTVYADFGGVREVTVVNNKMLIPHLGITETNLCIFGGIFTAAFVAVVVFAIGYIKKRKKLFL